MFKKRNIKQSAKELRTKFRWCLNKSVNGTNKTMFWRCHLLHTSKHTDVLTGTQHLEASYFAKYCDERVCLSVVCLSVCWYVQTSRNFLYMLLVVVARSSPDDSAVRYVLPVLWMMSFFADNGANRDTGHWRIIHCHLSQGRSLLSPTALCGKCHITVVTAKCWEDALFLGTTMLTIETCFSLYAVA